jgi:hypothetical protein
VKTKEITVGIGMKLNVGDYESIDPFISHTVEIEEGDDPDQVRANTHAAVRRELVWAADAYLQAVIDRRLANPSKADLASIAQAVQAALRSSNDVG